MKKLFLLIVLFISFFKIGYSQPGQLDSSFGVNGIVTTDLGTGTEYNVQGKQVLVLPDGSMYILFSDSKYQIVKKFSNGTTDVSYGNKGYSAYVPLTISKAALQPDGKLVVAGSSYQDRGDYDFAVARFNTDGSLDKTFNGSGLQTTSFGSDYDIATSIAIQSNGKIVVAGSSLGETNIVAIARYNTNGSLDTAFNGSGRQTTNFGTDVIANSIVIQSDGKIAAGCANNNKFLVVRYNANGSLADFFDGKGILTKANGSYFVSNALAIQKDNKIVAAGYWENNNANKDFTIVRFKVNGSIDSTFNSNGIQSTDFRTYDDYATSAVIQGDGKIVVAGYASNGLNYAFAIARYNTNGSADNTFDNDGKKMTFIGSSNVFALSVAIQNNGKLISVGYGQSAAAKTLKAIRYNTNGSLDSAFASNGTLTDHSKQGNTVYTSTAIQSDGKIISAGYTSNGSHFEFLVSRFSSNGKSDSTFSGDGSVTLNFGSADNKITSAAIQKDGKIVVTGGVFNGTNYDFGIARFNTDGSLDKTFSSDGKQTTDFGSNAIANSLVIQNNGKIVVVGYASDFPDENDPAPIDYAIARYNTDGTPDKSFSGDGKLTTNFGLTSKADAVAIQKDGKIVVAGKVYYAPDEFAIARYNTDGSLDSTFNGNGMEITYVLNTSKEYGAADVTSVFIKSDGKIIVGGYAGYSDRYFDANNTVLVSYNKDGSYDNTFSGDGVAIVAFPGSDASYTTSMALQDNGKIVVSADLNIYYEASLGIKPSGFAFARINTDGSLDNTFGENGLHIEQNPNDQILDIAISNKTLYAVGNRQDAGSLGLAAKYLLNLPFVSITSPADNTTYAAPATVTLKAIATEEFGSIKSVKFYNGNIYLKTVFTSPYTYTIKDLPAGNYSFTAKATDSTGHQSVSKPVSIVVLKPSSNKAPVVGITSPANGAFFTAPASFTINASATDADGSISKVQFYHGSTLLATDSTRPYTCRVNNLDSGYYKITAKATDNKGLSSSSSSVIVAVSAPVNQPPVVNISTPISNVVYDSGSAITITAAATDSDGSVTGIEIFSNGSLINSAGGTNSNPLTITITNLTPGNYSFVARAIDNQELISSSASVTVQVAAANKAPVVSITSPANNATYTAPANITVNAAASDADGSISSVKFYNGTTYLKTDFTSPYTYTISNLPAGTYSLTAKATDNYGAQTVSAPVTVIVSGASIVSNRPYSETEKTALNDALSLRLAPNPAGNIVNIYTGGLQQSKPATLSIISLSGIVLKTINISNSATQLDVSSLAGGVYTVKIVSGDKVTFGRFVKL